MTPEDKERFHELCKRIASEQDPETFNQLCKELNHLLNVKYRSLGRVEETESN